MNDRSRDFELVRFRGNRSSTGDIAEAGEASSLSARDSLSVHSQPLAASLEASWRLQGSRDVVTGVTTLGRTASNKSDAASAPNTFVLVTTDPPLKAAPRDLLPLLPGLLIQFDLPVAKVRRFRV
jgi:hypothetical protein